MLLVCRGGDNLSCGHQIHQGPWCGQHCGSLRTSFSCRSTLRSPSSPIHEEDEEKLSEDSDSPPALSGAELALRESSSPEVSVCFAGELL